jgi:hypothetical protein
LRPRLRELATFANVTSLIALFVALGGTSYAALTITGKNVKNSSLTGADIRNSSLTSRDIRDRTLLARDFKAGQLAAGLQGAKGLKGDKGDRGAPGAPGAAGAHGTNGTNGTNGANGSPAFGALLGRGVNVPAGTSFLAPSGQLAANANENNVSSFTPNATMTARDLAVTLSVATGLTDTRTFTVRIGNADTALSCTVPAGNTGCTSTQTVTIPGGSLVSIGSTSTGTPSPTDVRFGWRATG